MICCVYLVSGSERRLFHDVVTGVAILQVPRNIDRDVTSVAFGCIAQKSGTGGAGVVTKMGEDRKHVRRMRHSDVSSVYAGSMLATDACAEELQPRAVLNSAPSSVEVKSKQLLMMAVVFCAIVSLALHN